MRRQRAMSDASLEAAWVLSVLFLVGVAGVTGWAIGHGKGNKTSVGAAVSTTTQTTPALTVDPDVAAGAHEFVQFACAQCHGEQGRGGVSPDVPALTGVAKAFTAAKLRTIINHGLGESKTQASPTCRSGAK